MKRWRVIFECNAWQKLGPFPAGMTTPADRISDPLPPDEYKWKDMKWSQRNLIQMIKRDDQKYDGKFESQDEINQEGNFVWLKGITNATTALLVADERLATKRR